MIDVDTLVPLDYPNDITTNCPDPYNESVLMLHAVASANPYDFDNNDDYGTSMDRLMYWTSQRDLLRKKFAWAIPSPEAVKALVELGPIIEIGAGTGYWARMIADNGGDILAFDSCPPDQVANSHCGTKTWNPVNSGSHEECANHSERALMLCWPSYESDFATKCLSTYTGNVVAFIGEGKGGCTADDSFFDLLETEWVLESQIKIPNWAGFEDDLCIWRRR